MQREKMTNIRERIESAISKMKEEDSDLLILDWQLLNFDVPHILREFNTTFDYLHNYFNGSINHFKERAIMKFTILDMIDLKIELICEAHLNVYTNTQTRQFEGELLGFRFKNWRIVNYNLDLCYEGI